jgi:hypothetical protein
MSLGSPGALSASSVWSHCGRKTAKRRNQFPEATMSMILQLLELAAPKMARYSQLSECPLNTGPLNSAG